jgi:glycosyltransferase involved in cell wall biosynthesis
MDISKPRIAIIIYGGIGVGFGSEGVVCITELCEKIAIEYELTVFSFVEIDKGYEPKGYKLVGVPLGNNGKYLSLRFLYLFFKIILQHLQKPFVLFHGFVAFPSGLLTLILGKFFSKKTLISFMGGEVCNIPSIQYGLFQSNTTKNLIKFTAKNVDVIIAQTQNQAEQLQGNIEFRRMEIIHFGINLLKFPYFEKSLEAPFQFLYLGNINRVKDLPTLIKTFQIISQKVDTRLDIVGLDTLNGEIQQLVNQLGLSSKIVFHGIQLNHNLTHFLQKAHILLHTSLSEGQPVVANEAIASGVVICGTRVGILEDLENKITTVVDVGDADGLAQKVLDLLENPTKYQELRDNGLIWSKHNDLEIQSQKYLELYNSLLSVNNYPRE